MRKYGAASGPLPAAAATLRRSGSGAKRHIPFRRNADKSSAFSTVQRRRSQAVTALLIRIAMVIGPTPPGTGVIAPATSAAS